MKTITRILTAAATLSLLATGCINEDPAYLKNKPTEPTEGPMGYLTLGQTAFRVIYDTESAGDNTSGETVRPKTRATEPNVDTFIVEITKSADNSSVYKKTYGEMKSELATTPLTLEVGSYHLSIRSEEVSATPAVAMEHPVYGASRDFAITKGQTTSIEEVVCTLQNIKVTVACSADLISQLTSTTKSSVSLGSNSIDFALTETGAAFFMPINELNTLNFKLQGAFAETPDKPVSFSKSISNVKAGQWRKITLVITYASNGGINFDIKVDNFVQDDEITVNGAANLWEQVIDEEPTIDPSAPTIVWADHDLTQTFQLKATMFNAEGNCTEPFNFNLTSPNGIKSFVVTISSTSTEFMTSVNTYLGSSTFDLCTLTSADQAYTMLKAFGFPLGTQLKGQTTKSFDIAGAMSLLYNFKGTHTFSFALTDANGLTSNAALKILVDKENEGGSTAAPTIVWEGYDIDQTQTVVDGMKIKVVMTAAAGIKKCQVKIDMDKITDEDLKSMSIPPEFDLCNIVGIDYADPDKADVTAEEVAAQLSGLGFPVNNEIKGATSKSFDLTGFISAMKATAQGNNNFTVTVTDNNDLSTTKILKLYVPASN